MKRFFGKPYRWAMVYGALLTLAFTLVLLDAFVIPKARYMIVEPQTPLGAPPEGEAAHSQLAEPDWALDDPAAGEDTPAQQPVQPVRTENSYKDENISIQIETVREHDTTLYIADIQLSDVSYLKTAFAKDTYGRNIKEATSATASAKNAIFAVNGDYYGFRDMGFVLRNGVLYRDAGETTALALFADGSLQPVDEREISALSLLEGGAWQVWSFGPTLVQDGQVVTGADSEVAERSGNSNPRTAIGMIEPLHYVFIVSDGRTGESAGLSLHQLAQRFQQMGCATAYNLDGGGSSTMVFDGKVVNNPTNGRSAKERELSDIVYIGYE